jgi:hypothetical protein
MGYGDIVLEEGHDSYTINYFLPENTTQGADNWYLIHLNFTIDLEGSGLAYLNADTNGYACAQIKFEVQNESITWSWANFTEFGKEKANSKKVNIFFSNYLRYQGVKPGENNLTIKLEKF